jgi:hypothetical protein
LRVLLRDIMAGDRRNLSDLRDAPTGEEILTPVDGPKDAADPARANTAS